MDAKTIVRRSERTVSRELTDGSALILHMGSDAYHRLNPVGTAIWRLLEHPTSVADLVDRLRAVVADPPADMDRSTIGFLDRLAERELIDADQTDADQPVQA